MSDWSKLPLELSKFAVTGLLAFLSSYLYTNYATSPARNITIVPLSVQHDVACDVNRATLFEKLAAFRETHAHEAKERSEDDYATYLVAALGADRRLRDWGPWPILRSLIPPGIARHLEEDGILVCEAGDESLPTHTLLRGQAVVLLGRPHDYAMSRNCVLRSGGLEVPVRAWESEIPVMEVGAPEPSTAITVHEATNVFFLYDNRDAPRVSGEALRALLHVLSGREPYDLSILCPIVAPDGPVDIAGRPFPFKNRSLVGIGGGSFQLVAR
jgi:hypothetical protein